MKHFHYNIVLYEYLDGCHKDIVRDMLCDDFFIVQDKVYDIVYDVCYYGMMVGFLAGNVVDGVLVLELCYIRRKFRNLGLFNHALNTVNRLFDMDVRLYLPNTFAVDSLILHKWAIKLTNHLVITQFPLTWQDKNTDNWHYSRIYDTNICGIVDLHKKTVSPLLDVDILRYNPSRNINENYFTEVENEILKEI